MVLESGGGGDGSPSSEEEDDQEVSDAGRELAQRDATTGDTANEDADGQTQTRTRSARSGITSGEGDIATEPDVSAQDDQTDQEETDSQQQQASREELTQRDQGSDAGRDQAAAAEELTQRDQGSGAGQLGAAGQELTQRDPGSRDVSQIRQDAIREQAQQAAEETVDTTTQEGLEGPAGRSVTVDGRTINVQDQAEDLEQRAIDEAEWADTPEDVAIKLRDGRLVAVPSRSAAVDLTREQFETEIRTELGRRSRERDTVTLQADADGEVAEEDLEEAERELETTEATIPVPDTLTLFGPGGQVADVPVPFDDITLSGQTRDVELEQTESGGIEVTEESRFGDFDITIPEDGAPILNAPLNPVGFVAGEAISRRFGGQELEDVTGAAGDRLIEGGEAVGDVLARELVEERTVLPGAIVEERIQGDTDFVASATRNVPVGAAAIGDQALNLPQEAAEFAVEGATRAAQGEGREFAGAVGGAAVGAGILTAREARRDPGGFVGQLSGSAVGATGGIAAATRVAGPRAGRVVSTAVQPGEELAIAAARSGVVSPRTASLVPGVRRDHIGETSAEAPAADVTGGEAVASPGVRGRISSRLPDVRVEADPEAGVLEIDPALRQQVREAARAPPRRARQSVAAVEATARGGVERAVGAARRGRVRAEETVETVRDVELTAPDIRGAIRAGRRRARARADESEFLSATETGRLDPTDIETPSIGSTGLSRPSTPGLPQLRGRLPKSEFIAATETGRVDVAGLETPGIQRPSLDISRPSIRGRLPESEFLAATETERVRPSELEMPSLGGAGGGLPSPRAGLERVGEGVDDFIIRAQRGPAVTGDVALQQAFIRGSDLPYPTLGQATRTGRRRARQLRDFSSDVTERIGSAGRDVTIRVPPHRADITLQQAAFGEGDLPRPRAPSLDLPDVTGAVRREATAVRFRGAEAVSEGRRFAQDVSDVTIRVGDPPRTTLFDTETEDATPVLEADDTDTPFDSEPRTDPERSETDVDEDLDEPLDPTRTGVGIETEVGAPEMGQRLLMRSETESETSSVVEPMFETETNATRPRGKLGREEPEVQIDEISELDVEQASELSLEETAELETGVESRLETRQETRMETRVETRTETQQETRQELRQEVTTEPVSELRTELEADPRRDGGRRGDRRRRSGDAFTEEFEFGVASPEEVLSGIEGDLLEDS